jgi:hypothetical protein
MRNHDFVSGGLLAVTAVSLGAALLGPTRYCICLNRQAPFATPELNLRFTPGTYVSDNSYFENFCARPFL